MNPDSKSIPPEALEHLPPPDSRLGKLARGLLERYPIWPLLRFMAQKKVPVHRNSFWYIWGGMALFFFIVQVLTGILLMVYYRPAQPWASVQRIVMEVPFGSLIRSIHHWSANLMVLALFVHMFSSMFMRAYRRPRELTWLLGLLLLALTMAFGFSGYLLPNDDLAFYATNIGITEAEKLPHIGPWLAGLMRGGETVSLETVGRFFVLHVIVLPILVAMAVGVHLLFVQIQGVSEPDSFQALPDSRKRYKLFFGEFLWNELAVWMFLGILLVALSALFPRELAPEVDPFGAAPPGIKPEWYFLSQYQALKLFPGAWEKLGMLLLTAIPVWFALLPVVDRKTATGRRGMWVTAIGVFFLAAMIALSVWGVVS